MHTIASQRIFRAGLILIQSANEDTPTERQMRHDAVRTAAGRGLQSMFSDEA
jgi:hypothetical protein